MASQTKKMPLEIINEGEALSPMDRILKKLECSFCDQHFQGFLKKPFLFKLHLMVNHDLVKKLDRGLCGGQDYQFGESGLRAFKKYLSEEVKILKDYYMPMG